MKIGRLAPWYRWIEYAAFGRELEQRRFAFLKRLARSQRVLMLGEGDGRMLSRFLMINPTAKIDVVELSPEMIALAKMRIGNADGVTFRCEDARQSVWPEMYFDAIVTNFFLDCFSNTEAKELMKRLAGALAPGGIWVVSEFAIPPGGWRRLHAQLWIGTMYRFFRIVTGLRNQQLPAIEALMREARMQRTERETRRAGLVVSEIWRRRTEFDPTTPLSGVPRI